MRIAVCGAAGADAQQMVRWIEEYCALYQVPAALETFPAPEQFSDCQDRFDVAYLCYGGSTGFLQARLLRERDKSCRIVLVDDTQEYVVASKRIHCSDFILRPVTFSHIVRSMNLAVRGVTQ